MRKGVTVSVSWASNCKVPNCNLVPEFSCISVPLVLFLFRAGCVFHPFKTFFGCMYSFLHLKIQFSTYSLWDNQLCLHQAHALSFEVPNSISGCTFISKKTFYKEFIHWHPFLVEIWNNACLDIYTEYICYIYRKFLVQVTLAVCTHSAVSYIYLEIWREKSLLQRQYV